MIIRTAVAVIALNMPLSAASAADTDAVEAARSIAAALNGDAKPDSASRLIHADATFVGDKSYPFTIANMREFLRSRHCGTVEAVDNERVRSIAAMARMTAPATHEAISGPGLWVYCADRSRVAAHELYGLHLEQGKLRRVHFTTAIVPPAPPPPPPAPK